MPTEWEKRPPLSLVVAQQGVADAAGTIQVGPGTGEDTTIQTAFAGPYADFVLYGVINGAFAQGPVADPTGWIDPVNNPLPYWAGPTQVSGGAIQCSRVADASSPSGYNLRFTINPGAAGDEAYVEQTVPIGGMRSRTATDWVHSTFHATSGTATFRAVLSVAYLDAAFVLLGSASEITKDFNATLTTDRVIAGWLTSSPVDAAAAYLRIRIGVRRAGGAVDADSCAAEFSNVRRDFGHTVYLLSDATTPGSVNGYIALDSARLTISRARAAGVALAAQTPGSLILDSTGTWIDGLLTLTGGQIDFPVAQNSSSDVNTLDDYEEGTFTPALAYATVGTSSWAVNFQLGWYTKIGNVVNYTLFYSGVPTNGTGAGNLTLSGLPFTAKGTTNEHHLNACNMGGYTKATATWISLRILQGTTTAEFYGGGSGVAVAALVVADIPSAGTVIVRSSGIYFTAT